MGRTISFLLMLAVWFVIAGCQTPRYREFDSVKSGMSKGEVLANVGGPETTDRRQGLDRWTYILHDHPEGRQVREVHFNDGLAVYVGPKVKPAVSAEEQDRQNEIYNREADARDRESQSGTEVQRFVPVGDSEDEGPVRIQSKPGVSQ